MLRCLISIVVVGSSSVRPSSGRPLPPRPRVRPRCLPPVWMGWWRSRAAVATAWPCAPMAPSGAGAATATGNSAPHRPGGGMITATPIQATGLDRVQGIATGSDHGLAVRADGTVWAWGKNDHGQVGVPQGENCSNHPRPCVQVPVPVPGLSGVKAVAAAGDSSFALGADGTVWAWGANESGQLGTGTTTDLPSPTRVDALTDITSLSSAEPAASPCRPTGRSGTGAGRRAGEPDAGCRSRRCGRGGGGGSSSQRGVAGRRQRLGLGRSTKSCADGHGGTRSHDRDRGRGAAEWSGRGRRHCLGLGIHLAGRHPSRQPR